MSLQHLQLVALKQYMPVILNVVWGLAMAASVIFKGLQ